MFSEDNLSISKSFTVGDYIDVSIQHSHAMNKILEIKSLGISRIPWLYQRLARMPGAPSSNTIEAEILKRNLAALSKTRKTISDILDANGFIEVNISQEIFNLYGHFYDYLRSSICSVATLYDAPPPDDLRKTYQISQDPITSGIDPLFSLNGSWLYLGMAGWETFDHIEDIIRQLLQGICNEFKSHSEFFSFEKTKTGLEILPSCWDIDIHTQILTNEKAKLLAELFTPAPNQDQVDASLTMFKLFDQYSIAPYTITTGAQREHRYDVLIKQAEEKGVPVESIQFYVDFFKYGCPPHGGLGFGLGFGLARLLAILLNITSIRDVVFLHRSPNRLIP